MKFIALNLVIEGAFGDEKGLYVCVHDEPAVLNEVEPSYPIEHYNKFNGFISHEGDEYRVVARLSKKVNDVEDGQELNPDDLFWGELTALPESRTPYKPVMDRLFEKREAWIYSSISKRCTVETIC